MLYSTNLLVRPSLPILTIFGLSGIRANMIDHAKFHVDRLRGFGWAGT
jgi:hypothetical protein